MYSGDPGAPDIPRRVAYDLALDPGSRWAGRTQRVTQPGEATFLPSVVTSVPSLLSPPTLCPVASM